VPCARLSWPFCQLLSARKYIILYRIVWRPAISNMSRRLLDLFQCLIWSLMLWQNMGRTGLSFIMVTFHPSMIRLLWLTCEGHLPVKTCYKYSTKVVFVGPG